MYTITILKLIANNPNMQFYLTDHPDWQNQLRLWRNFSTFQSLDVQFQLAGRELQTAVTGHPHEI